MEHDIFHEVAVTDLSSVTGGAGGSGAIFIPPNGGNGRSTPPPPPPAATKLTDDGNLLGGLNKIECTAIPAAQGKASAGFDCTESLFGRELRKFRLVAKQP